MPLFSFITRYPWKLYFYGFLALMCLIFAFRVFHEGHPKEKIVLPLNPPPSSEYLYSISGAGIIEASSENIAIGTELPGIIEKIYVQAGDTVSAGTPLFSLDTRALSAQKKQLEAGLALAEAKLSRLLAEPRAETLPPLEAQVKESGLLLEQAKLLWKNVEPLQGTGAIGEEALLLRQLGYKIAEASLLNKKSNLDLLKAGAWKKDLEIAYKELALAHTNLEANAVSFEQSTVCAPMDGTVLRIYIHPGEFASNSSQEGALILFGAKSPLYIRVDIDDRDIGRYHSNMKAYAVPRGNASKKYPLDYVRTEPYVVPKRNLTGLTTELVDTRVLQPIYSLPKNIEGIHVGQQMDVFIETTDS